MTDIILCGCNGRMGLAISKMAAERDDINIVCGIDIFTKHNDAYPVYGEIGEFSGKADVIVDFSNSAGKEKLLDYAVSNKTPVVIATTGLETEHKEMLRKAAEKIPVFYSANMSLGVNLLCQLAKKAAAVLGLEYDIEIIEKHHNKKLDAPSGTAIMIADEISTVFDSPHEYVYDRHAVRKKREQSEIGIHAVRGGSIVGEHDVLFAGMNENITISHSALSREVFADGAIFAAKFLKGKPAGYYDMSSLIGD